MILLLTESVPLKDIVFLLIVEKLQNLMAEMSVWTLLK